MLIATLIKDLIESTPTEKLIIEEPPLEGFYTLRVSAHKIGASSSQSYGLVMSGICGVDTTDVAYGPETAFDEGDEIRFKAVGLPADTEVDVYMVCQGDDFFTEASVSLTDQRADGKITLTTNSDGTLTGTLISSTAIVNRPVSNSACCSGNTALYKIRTQ